MFKQKYQLFKINRGYNKFSLSYYALHYMRLYKISLLFL